MPGKEASRVHSAQQAGSRRGKRQAADSRLRWVETEESGEMLWDAEQGDRGRRLGRSASIASQPLLPGQARMSALRTSEDNRQAGKRSLGGRLKPHVQARASQQFQTRSAMLPPTPITPEDRGRAHVEGVKQDTHPAWMLGARPVPLTLLTQRAGTTGASAGFIDDPQASMCFAARFAWKEGLACRTLHRPIGLEGKSLPSEAPRFPGPSDHRWAIASSRHLPTCSLGHSARKLGGARLRRAEPMTQLQPEVPDPLIDDLPDFLSGGGMRAPAIRVLFLVFIRKRGFKGAPMQIQLDHIGGGEAALGQVGVEEFVDDALASHANAALRLACRMGCHHHAGAFAFWSHRHLGAVVERTRHLAWRRGTGADRGEDAASPG